MKKILPYASIVLIIAGLFAGAASVKADDLTDGNNSCTYQGPVVTYAASNGGGGGAYDLDIDNNATSTATTTVTLSLYGTQAYTMELSNTADFASSSWEPYVTTHSWTLTSGAGQKMVYVKFRAVGGNVVGSAENSIGLVMPLADPPAGQVLGVSVFQFTTNLHRGSEGIDVTKLQTVLTADGLYAGPIIGYFGPLTAAAVEAYQTKNGLPSTGFVGPLTRAQLNADLLAL